MTGGVDSAYDNNEIQQIFKGMGYHVERVKTMSSRGRFKMLKIYMSSMNALKAILRPEAIDGFDGTDKTYRVTQYIDQKYDWPCKKCGKRGHLDIYCPQEEERCPLCGVTGHRSSRLEECHVHTLGGKAVLQCVNCSDEHPVNDKGCPKVKEWKEEQRRFRIGKGSQQGRDVGEGEGTGEGT